jgi:hypothetical protein
VEASQSVVRAAPVVVGEPPGHVDPDLVAERRSPLIHRDAFTGPRAGEDDRVLIAGLCNVGHCTIFLEV